MTSPAELRAALPMAYYAFFGRHGRPRPIQLTAAEPLLARRDALLMAPSAAGKTEAACAPLSELAAKERRPPPALLIVSPTRALANDLSRRLQGPLAQMELPLGRWTGEHKESSRGLPLVTVTTPEALDSLLARRPRRLQELAAIVLDELHILDGTPRGDQLRMLLGRLRRLANDIHAVGLSATVAHPQAMASRYLRAPLLLRDRHRHTIKARLVSGREPAQVARTLRELGCGRRTDKVLLFTNRRIDVERYAAELRARQLFGGAVFAHHGSLSRAVRESAEERFQAVPRGLCVATTTLELGVDIGDVDLVGLLSPPPDVASLIQRVGRSGRRSLGPRVVCFAASPAESFRYRTLLELAAAGDLAADPAVFHPSVLVQQSISVLHQNPGRWVTAAALHRRLEPALAARWPVERLGELLRHLGERSEWLLPAGQGRYVASEHTERLWSRGQLHSNIGAAEELEVVDGLTDQVIGSIAAPTDHDHVHIGGRGRQVVHQDGRRIIVGEVIRSEAPRFTPRGVPILSRALARAHGSKLGLSPGQWALVDQGGGGALVLHFGGTAWGLLLASALQCLPPELAAPSANARVARPGPFGLVVGDRALARVPRLELDELRLLARRLRARLARALAMGPYHRDLPLDEAAAALEEAAALEALAQELATAELVAPPTEVDPEVWRGLVAKS